MNKGFFKVCSAMVLSAFLVTSAVSNVRAADFDSSGEIELNNASEFYTQSSETFEAKDISWVDSVLIIKDSEDVLIPARQITKEQLEQEVKEGQVPWMAAVVFELTEEGKKSAKEYQKMQQNTDGNEESFDVEKPEAVDSLYGDFPSVSLTEEQKQMVIEIAKIVPQTVVLFNQCVPEDNMLFRDIEAIKAVTSIEASDKNEVMETVKNFDLEQEYMNYIQLQAISVNTFGLRSSSQSGSGSQSERSSENSSESNSESNSESGSESESSSESNNSTSTQSTVKDITVTLVPDEVLEEDDYLSATYQIKTEKELTYLKGTLTYDVSVMTYDVIENSEDAVQNSSEENGYGFKILTSPNDNNGQAGKIEFEYRFKTPQSLNGDLIDVYFDLLNPAKIGDKYKLNLVVDEVKNETTTLTSEVVSQEFAAVADPDLESETETENQTQQTQSQTTSTEGPLTTNAPKTGDETNIVVFFFAIVCSAFVFLKTRKRV